MSCFSDFVRENAVCLSFLCSSLNCHPPIPLIAPPPPPTHYGRMILYAVLAQQLFKQKSLQLALYRLLSNQYSCAMQPI